MRFKSVMDISQTNTVNFNTTCIIATLKKDIKKTMHSRLPHEVLNTCT